MKELYSNNPDFKTYVDKYCITSHVNLEEALSHATVKEVGDYYRRKENVTKNS